MRSNISLRAVLVLAAAVAILGLAAGAARAATFSSSPTQPTVDGVDIWNFGTQTSNDKWFFQSGNEADPADWAKGQTFTTGASEVLLSALTYKMDPTVNKAANTTYTIRMGMPSGTSFNQIYGETALQTVNTGVGDYMTWTFDSPVLLAPNTTYGIDVSMVSAVAWQTGIPYLSCVGNTYAGGSLYQSGPTGGSGPGPTISVDTTKDRVFHLNMTAWPFRLTGTSTAPRPARASLATPRLEPGARTRIGTPRPTAPGQAPSSGQRARWPSSPPARTPREPTTSPSRAHRTSAA